MKNTTQKNACKNNLRKQPSEKTLWAYFMQAIEPKSEAINQAFPDYHPQWVQQSQQLSIAAENFKHLRNMLGMSRKQCSAYLRTSPVNIANWEQGRVKIPFSAFELMRMILESVRFKISHASWDGWFISDNGKLMSPDYGRAGYTPEQLNLYTLKFSENAWLRGEVSRTQNVLDEAIEENTRLRQLFLSNGVVDELATMKDKLIELLAKVGTAHVIAFPTVAREQQPQEKVA